MHSLPFGALILLGTALGCKIGGDGLVVTKIEALQKLAFLRLEDLAGPGRPWVRNSLKTSLPQKPWEESREAFGARLRDAAREANTKYDVDGLCRDFPSRIADLKARSGDRLGK